MLQPVYYCSIPFYFIRQFLLHHILVMLYALSTFLSNLMFSACKAMPISQTASCTSTPLLLLFCFHCLKISAFPSFFFFLFFCAVRGLEPLVYYSKPATAPRNLPFFLFFSGYKEYSLRPYSLVKHLNVDIQSETLLSD